MNKPNGISSARVIKVIETMAKRGLGTEKDPVRIVTQYWDFDGNLLAESDHIKERQMENRNIEKIIEEFNENENSFIKSEVLRLLCETNYLLKIVGWYCVIY